ncbi:MAG: MATE family efflux transporter [Bacilli bacterium]
MKKRDLTRGKVTKSLLIVAVPTMLTQLLMFSYNIVDLKFVSALGTTAIAAVGSATLFVGIGNSVNALCVVGTGIKASHSAGKNDLNSFHRALNSGYIINVVVNVLYILLLVVFPRQLLAIINISDETVIEMAVTYMRIFAFASFFQFTNNLIIRVLGGLGLSDKTLYVSIVGVVINIILDPIFIYTFKLGVGGAALASLIGNLVITVIFIKMYYSTLRFSKSEGINIPTIISTLKLGIPYMLQRLTFTFVGIWMGRIVARYGIEAIASQKIGHQVESITFMIVGGMFAAMAAFAGQNMGAKQFERIKEGYSSAIKIGICYALLTSFIFILFPEEIAKLFDSNPLTIKYTVYYLQIIAFGQIFAVLEMVGNGLYTGIGIPKVPATISIVFTVLRIPLAIILSYYFGIIGVFLSISLTSIVKGLISYGIYRFKVSKQIGNTIVSK